jgi:hypothetical protein
MKPAGTDIMDEFYKDHTHDPDTNGVRILDPFMGGGTTVVEALRLGCHVTGIDLNPVAWFIVKTEVEPVNIEDLKAAFKRLEERPASSGKNIKGRTPESLQNRVPLLWSRKRGSRDNLYLLGQISHLHESHLPETSPIIFGLHHCHEITHCSLPSRLQM